MNKIEASFDHRGLRCVVLQGLSVLTHRCGYVGVPPTHPLYKVHYSDSIPKTDALLAKALSNSIEDIGIINALCAKDPDDADFLTPVVLLAVHGGITYSKFGEKDYPESSNTKLWWFGFDTGHHGDDPKIGGQPLDYVKSETIRLADQLADFTQG